MGDRTSTYFVIPENFQNKFETTALAGDQDDFCPEEESPGFLKYEFHEQSYGSEDLHDALIEEGVPHIYRCYSGCSYNGEMRVFHTHWARQLDMTDEGDPIISFNIYTDEEIDYGQIRKVQDFAKHIRFWYAYYEDKGIVNNGS